VSAADEVRRLQCVPSYILNEFDKSFIVADHFLHRVGFFTLCFFLCFFFFFPVQEQSLEL
jgi:hypothetical protein